MGITSPIFKVLMLNIMIIFSFTTTSVYGNNFNAVFERTFGDHRVNTYGQDSQGLSLSLDKYSGSGFRSKKEYLFGRFDMQLKLVSGDSAGTVTTLYLSSNQKTGTHDEIDFEFLGNVSGQPYTLHTNVFSQGQGGREQQFHLWFLVDETPLRVFRNHEDIGVPFPKNQPMKMYSSLWNADDWATQGGLVKTDWSKAPFTAYYRNFNIDSNAPNAATLSTNGKKTRGAWRTRDLNAWGRRRLRWVQKYFMIYDYCADSKRFTQGVPAECKRSRF
ncbi:putative xyloglucan endotransglucosylase/hydrolase protein 16 [Bienertia sinuspersici]